MIYKPVRLNLSKSQLLRAVKSKPIKVRYEQINSGEQIVLLHPMTYKALLLAFKKKKGMTFILAPGEIKATVDSDLTGTGIFDFLKKGFNWVKNHWGDIKPVLSTVLDVGSPALASMYPQGAQAIIAGRKLIKQTTGVGVAPCGKGLYL
jgi:hypothetical protein